MFMMGVNRSWYCSFVPGEFRVLVPRFESDGTSRADFLDISLSLRESGG